MSRPTDGLRFGSNDVVAVVDLVAITGDAIAFWTFVGLGCADNSVVFVDFETIAMLGFRQELLERNGILADRLGVGENTKVGVPFGQFGHVRTFLSKLSFFT